MSCPLVFTKFVDELTHYFSSTHRKKETIWEHILHCMVDKYTGLWNTNKLHNEILIGKFLKCSTKYFLSKKGDKAWSFRHFIEVY